MTSITKYIATDGREFRDEQACLKYEADGCVEFSPLPDYGEHLTLTDEHLRWTLDGDGTCYYATEHPHVTKASAS